MTSGPARQHHPPLAISAHGIRTYGQWQKTFASVVSGSPTKISSYDFGRYGLVRFLIPYFNNKKIDEFYEWYSISVRSCPEVDLKRHDGRPSLVAHSFGTWIAGYAMLKYEDIRFDKIILFGSILPRDFDWGTLFARDQVGRVRNECGQKDPWPRWAGRLVVRAGTGGSEGFDWYGSAVKNVRCEEFGHDEFSKEQHMRSYWLDFLRLTPSPLFVLHGHDIHEEDAFDRLLTHTRTVIDKEAYGGFSHYDEAKLPDKLSLSWISVNPDIYTFLIDRNTKRPGGYINAMPVTDKAYNAIREGKIIDREVSAADIVPYGNNQAVKMYLMSIAILKRYRQWGDGPFHQAYTKLLAAFVDKLLLYAKSNSTYVTHLLATAWTPEGRKICDSFGMQPIGNDRFGDPIYELDLRAIIRNPRAPTPPVLKRVVEAYRRLDTGP